MNTQNAFFTTVVVGVIFLFSSCAVYKPTGYNTLTQNVPLMKDKYEFQTMFTVGFNHSEEQIAFAPGEHLSLLGNFYQNLDKTLGYSAEGGIGYFKSFSSSGVMEVYGIFTNADNYAHIKDDNGSGLFSNLIDYTHDLVANYNGYSLQFDIGNKLPNSEFGIGFRYSLIDYLNFYYHLKTVPYSIPIPSDTTYYLDHKLCQFVTIAPTYKFGWTSVKFLIQLSYHLDLTGTQAANTKDVPPYYSSLLLSIGLIGDFFPAKSRNSTK